MPTQRHGTSGLASGLLALCLPLAGTPALAATEVQLHGRIGPVIREVPRHQRPLALTISARFSGDQPGGLPPVLARSIVNFPYGSALNGRLFPSCAPRTVNRRGLAACPGGSVIGSGHAIGVGAEVRQRLRVTLLNGRGGRSVVFYLRGNNPLRVNTAFAAPLRRLHGGRWNFELTIDVPKNLQIVAGVELALAEFESTVRATRRTRGRNRGYIEAWACPPGARVPLRGRFIFLESPSVLVNSWITCR